MGTTMKNFLNNLTGNMSESTVNEAARKLKDLLVSNETVEKSFKIFRDAIVFTNLRIILIDVQGVTGSKVSYHSIPYKSIVSYEIETAGTLDLDSELKIYISGQAEPLKKEFKKGSNIKEVGQLIGEHLLHV
ncbi:hypothetical protein CH76_07590 [Lysinibacillus sp. BF-4]|nr:hypothetical protein CH76_07590 [Lysinibacillus sp. BF-4]